MCVLILLNSTTVPHQEVSPNEPKSVYLRDLILIVSSLLYLQVALSGCESGMYSRIIHFGRKDFVVEIAGAFSLVLV